MIRGELDVPEGRKARLRVKVSHPPHGDWQLVVRADGQVLLERVIGASTVTNEWADLEIDLKSVEGKRVKLELENRATGWSNEWAYWNEIALAVD